MEEASVGRSTADALERRTRRKKLRSLLRVPATRSTNDRDLRRRARPEIVGMLARDETGAWSGGHYSVGDVVNPAASFRRFTPSTARTERVSGT
mgnify:CR=1 FL=1